MSRPGDLVAFTRAVRAGLSDAWVPFAQVEAAPFQHSAVIAYGYLHGLSVDEVVAAVLEAMRPREVED